jgi:hypothetical protein
MGLGTSHIVFYCRCGILNIGMSESTIESTVEGVDAVRAFAIGSEGGRAPGPRVTTKEVTQA